MLPQSEAHGLTPIDEFTSQPKAWTQVVGGIAKLLPAEPNSGPEHRVGLQSKVGPMKNVWSKAVEP